MSGADGERPSSEFDPDLLMLFLVVVGAVSTVVLVVSLV